MKLIDFIKIISVNKQEWDLALLNNNYYTFKIPKKNGKYRIIEAPCPELKIIQKKIAHYFQFLYHKKLPQSVHGYIRKDPTSMIVRDIRTNAMAHFGCNYLLNIDLKDFFHQIDTNIFNKFLEESSLDKAVKKSLRKICLKNNRLPMGAPTSPVLSNIAFRDVDLQLEHYCKENSITYSRYVDDLSFSSSRKLTDKHFLNLKKIISDSTFIINTNKIKWYGKNEDKLITGVILDGLNLRVSDEMVKRTEKNLAIYTKLMRMKHYMRYLGMSSTKKGKHTWKEIRASVKGHLGFIKLIEGKDSLLYKRIRKAYVAAATPKRDFEFTIYI